MKRYDCWTILSPYYIIDKRAGKFAIAEAWSSRPEAPEWVPIDHFKQVQKLDIGDAINQYSFLNNKFSPMPTPRKKNFDYMIIREINGNYVTLLGPKFGKRLVEISFSHDEDLLPGLHIGEVWLVEQYTNTRNRYKLQFNMTLHEKTKKFLHDMHYQKISRTPTK